MTTIKEPLELDRNPTPKEEAKEFENLDEKVRAHELELLKGKRGWVGKITGSTNEALNTGLFVLVIAFFMLAIAMFGLLFTKVFEPFIQGLMNLVAAALGYVLGTKKTD